MHQLAIVIPAFKVKYFNETLKSFAEQTDRRFRLYIGDDASPCEFKTIISQYKNAMDITYFRFSNNLGATSLAEHWMRCIRLTSEPWTWFFSDDDTVGSTCVADFYAAIRSADVRKGIYRFELAMIDASGELIRLPPPLPYLCGPYEFLYHKIVNCAGSAAPEHVFSREAFERVGGFVDFPSATCSDDATWMLLSREQPMVVIPGGKVNWRQSEVNISGGRSRLRNERALACLHFIEWLMKECSQGGRLFPRTDEEWVLLTKVFAALPEWFGDNFRFLEIPISKDYDPTYWIADIQARTGMIAPFMIKQIPPVKNKFMRLCIAHWPRNRYLARVAQRLHILFGGRHC